MQFAYTIEQNLKNKKDEREKMIQNFEKIISKEPYELIIKKESLLNRYFDHVYVINRELYRRVTIIDQFKKMGIKYTFIKGLNGLDPECETEWKAYKGDIENPGVWGYYQTMSNIFIDAIEKEYNSIVCFDDDVIFHNNFEQILSKVAFLFKRKWMMIYLGCSQFDWRHISPVSTNFLTYYHPNNSDGSFAMAYHKNSFVQLLLETKKLIGTFDTNALKSVYNTHNNKCFVIYPNLVIADLTRSTLRPGVSMEQGSKKFRWELSQYNINRATKIAILIYHYNDLERLLTILKGWVKQSYRFYQIYILDDNSNLELVKTIEKLESERITIKKNKWRMGFIPTLKRWMSIISEQIIYITDCEYIVKENHLPTVLKFIHKNHPIVIPKTIYKNGSGIEYKSCCFIKDAFKLEWRLDQTLERWIKDGYIGGTNYQITYPT